MAEPISIDYETFGISELRLKLTEIVHRIERQKSRALVRRRFDVVAAVVPIEDFENIVREGRLDENAAIVIRSIQEARDGFAGFIDKILGEKVRFIIQQRDVRIAALVPLLDLKIVDPEIYATLAARNIRTNSIQSLAAATSAAAPAASSAPIEPPEIVTAADLKDQNGRPCLEDGMLVLRTRGNRRVLSGIVSPSIPASKLMIKIGEQIVTISTPVANKTGYFDLGEIEIYTGATIKDVELIRLA